MSQQLQHKHYYGSVHSFEILSKSDPKYGDTVREEVTILKTFFINDKVNKNYWQTTWEGMKQDAKELPGVPLVLKEDLQHPQYSKQDNYDKGTIIDYDIDEEKHQIIVYIRLTDDTVAQRIRDHELQYVSPAVIPRGNEHMRKVGGIDVLDRSLPLHLCIVGDPAYGTEDAQMTHLCTGNGTECFHRLKMMTAATENGEKGNWITSNGQHIFIPDGADKGEIVREHFNKLDKDKPKDTNKDSKIDNQSKNKETSELITNIWNDNDFGDNVEKLVITDNLKNSNDIIPMGQYEKDSKTLTIDTSNYSSERSRLAIPYVLAHENAHAEWHNTLDDTQRKYLTENLRDVEPITDYLETFRNENMSPDILTNDEVQENVELRDDYDSDIKSLQIRIRNTDDEVQKDKFENRLLQSEERVKIVRQKLKDNALAQVSHKGILNTEKYANETHSEYIAIRDHHFADQKYDKEVFNKVDKIYKDMPKQKDANVEALTQTPYIRKMIAATNRIASELLKVKTASEYHIHDSMEGSWIKAKGMDVFVGRDMSIQKAIDAQCGCSLTAAKNEKGRWITSNGQHIFIPEGKDIGEVVKNHFDRFTNPKTDTDKIQKDIGELSKRYQKTPPSRMGPLDKKMKKLIDEWENTKNNNEDRDGKWQYNNGDPIFVPDGAGDEFWIDRIERDVDIEDYDQDTQTITRPDKSPNPFIEDQKKREKTNKKAKQVEKKMKQLEFTKEDKKSVSAMKSKLDELHELSMPRNYLDHEVDTELNLAFHKQKKEYLEVKNKETDGGHYIFMGYEELFVPDGQTDEEIRKQRGKELDEENRQNILG